MNITCHRNTKNTNIPTAVSSMIILSVYDLHLYHLQNIVILINHAQKNTNSMISIALLFICAINEKT